MIYYGPKIKVDYDHLVFEPIDEVVIMQQHCGGESITVYKDHLKSGGSLSIDSFILLIILFSGVYIRISSSCRLFLWFNIIC